MQPSSQPQTLVSRFGRFLRGIEPQLRGVIEGLSARLIPTGLEKSELANRLVQTLEEEARHSAQWILVPNLYDVSLSRKDYDRYDPFRQSLRDYLQKHLTDTARTRGYYLQSLPVVELHLDPHLGPGRIQIKATFVDRQHVPSDPNLAQELIEAGLHGTQMFSSHLPPAAPPPALVLPQARLTLLRGQRPAYSLNHETTKIGRHDSNDIVIAEPQLSRYHACIQFENGEFVLYDLASKNGVRVNGNRATKQTLHSGDRIAIGNIELLFERR